MSSFSSDFFVLFIDRVHSLSSQEKRENDCVRAFVFATTLDYNRTHTGARLTDTFHPGQHLRVSIATLPDGSGCHRVIANILEKKDKTSREGEKSRDGFDSAVETIRDVKAGMVLPCRVDHIRVRREKDMI